MADTVTYTDSEDDSTLILEIPQSSTKESLGGTDPQVGDASAVHASRPSTPDARDTTLEHAVQINNIDVGENCNIFHRMVAFVKNQNMFKRNKHDGDSSTNEPIPVVVPDQQTTVAEPGSEPTCSAIKGEREQDKTSKSDVPISLKKLKGEFKSGKAKLNATSQQMLNSDKLNELMSTHPRPKVVTHFMITKCNLKDIPINIGLFENVTVMDLRSNALSNLPWSIIFLKQLHTLNLGDNFFRSLPMIVCRLRTLTTLNVESNLLQTLPTALLQLENLRNLTTQNNKLPVCILNKTVHDIFSELRKRNLRKNEWDTCKPWISSTDECTDPHSNLQSLWNICIDVILLNKVDFLHMVSVPPRIKTHLSEVNEEYSNRIQLAKCNKCSAFFSNTDYFDNHNC